MVHCRNTAFGLNRMHGCVQQKTLPDDLLGDADARPLRPRGDGERLSFPAGLVEASRWYGCFLGGVFDIRFTAFLGEGEPVELLPDVEAERERLLQDVSTSNLSVSYMIRWSEEKNNNFCTYLRTGERLGLCLELTGPRLGGLLRRGDILLLGLGLLRGE